MAVKLGTVVAAGAASLALAGMSPNAAVAATTTTSMTAAAPVSATVMAAPRPSVRWLCGKRIVKKFIPACSHGRWEPTTIKKMRCLQGHAPYVGWTGPAKLAYWANRCFKTSEWEKW
ncbi:hypothetical protein Nocox_39975 [Nonomuraea coxensis DSM 45129]|uniref:Uncharacterized protein n=2 Tax=Nonomuraea coxensis TaxID=404386 RepID=A0ABX8UGL5_9ACTN|nr:hypothetical protein Nocox_39975 [Nonomuraea coxensis DSM 45129]